MVEFGSPPCASVPRAAGVKPDVDSMRALDAFQSSRNDLEKPALDRSGTVN